MQSMGWSTYGGGFKACIPFLLGFIAHFAFLPSEIVHAQEAPPYLGVTETAQEQFVKANTIGAIELREVPVDRQATLKALGSRYFDVINPSKELKSPEHSRFIGNVEVWTLVGKLFWELIKAGAPIANVSTTSVSVVPVTQQDWAKMSNWRGPAMKSFVLEVVNILGEKVASYTYTLSALYGGKYQGQGSYLANLTVIPSKIDVHFMWSLESQVEVSAPVNVGTQAKPIPAVILTLPWRIKSLLSLKQGRDTFRISGDGVITRLDNGPYTRAY